MADGLPTWHPPREVLELAELLLSGALAELPAPVRPPHELVEQARDAGGLVLEDAEGTPVATLTAARSLRSIPGRPFTHGPLRSRRRAPAELRRVGERKGLLAVPVTGPLTTAAVTAVLDRATSVRADVLWLAVVGAGRAAARPPETRLPPEALLRAVHGARVEASGRGVPGEVVAVAVPLLPGTDDAQLLADVCRGYGATEVLIPVGVRGDVVAWHPASAREVERARRPPHRRGVAVFLTGLSGSGKSTIARGLAERLLDDGRRAVSLLDGDEVRRLLSHGLGFSRADRDLNIRRIGFVAAEIARHGGVAICAPIAPFAGVRREVRERVEETGDFILVHVSTPLAECERRDRKGLYARARQGLVPEFTGISSPYEPPSDADLRLDTTHLSEVDAVALVWDFLQERGYLGPTGHGSDRPVGHGSGRPVGQEPGRPRVRPAGRS
jgi:sulfate adenylyltransferase